MIERIISKQILEATKKMPVICVTGPRQSGKTTLVRNLFPNYRYYNLEFPQHREFAEKDAVSLLSEWDSGIIIDEIQRVPEILSSIQFFADQNQIPGKLIITGSQNLLLMQSVSQTLAGRVALFNLLPFSVQELTGTEFEEANFENYFLKSFYPRIYDQQLNPEIWLQDYINTYIERDVRQITAVKDLSLFSNFLKLCAGHTGQIINLSTFSNNLGLDQKTIKSWLSILETSYIVFLQPAYFKNFSKRIIKTPKLFFYDTGLACNILGIRTKIDFESHYLRGGLFESFVISEFWKIIFNRKLNSRIYYFRDSNGNEVDTVIEHAGFLKAVEIKSGKTIIPDFLKGLSYLDKISDSEKIGKYVVYGGEENQNRSFAKILSWRNMAQVFEQEQI
jgi:predicted AAA+ superfamily ATPase